MVGAKDPLRRGPSQAAIFWAHGPLFFTHMTQGMQTTLPYVIGVFMVRDFLSAASSSATGGTPPPPPSEAQVGKLTGLLGASFCAAQLVTSYPLGRLSDRIGRRPLILLGNLSCIVSVLAFGFSATYAQATLSRIVGGLTNAVIGAEKAILGESLGPEEQSLAMAHLSMMWGVGVLLGPALGGLLARPCGEGAVLGDSGDIAGIINDTTTTSPLRSPSSGGLLCSSQGLLRQRPFLLPCVAAAALNAIALVLTALFLEESLPSKRRGGTSGSAALYTAVSSADVEDIRAATHASVGSGNAEIEMSRPIAANDSLGGSEPYSRPVSRQDRGAVPAAAGSRSSLGVRNDEQCRRLRTADSVVAELADVELADVEGFKPKQTVTWHRQPNVVLCLSGYALIAFCFILLEELTPIFASAAPAEGGLGWQTSTLAAPLSFGGLVLCTWALFGYPRIVKRFGPLTTCRHGLIATIPMCMSIPAASVLPATAVVWVAMALKSIAGVNSFTPCLVLVNLVAPKDALGAINGVGQTLASAVRALGPALGGYAWAFSIQIFKGMDLPPFGHQFLPFTIAAASAVAALAVYHHVKLLPEGALRDDIAGHHHHHHHEGVLDQEEAEHVLRDEFSASPMIQLHDGRERTSVDIRQHV